MLDVYLLLIACILTGFVSFLLTSVTSLCIINLCLLALLDVAKTHRPKLWVHLDVLVILCGFCGLLYGKAC